MIPTTVTFPHGDPDDQEPLLAALYLPGEPVRPLHLAGLTCEICEFPASDLGPDPRTGDAVTGDAAAGNHLGLVVTYQDAPELGLHHLRCLTDGGARVDLRGDLDPRPVYDTLNRAAAYLEEQAAEQAEADRRQAAAEQAAADRLAAALAAYARLQQEDAARVADRRAALVAAREDAQATYEEADRAYQAASAALFAASNALYTATQAAARAGVTS